MCDVPGCNNHGTDHRSEQGIKGIEGSIEWRGNLDDDCTVQIGDLIGRCECLSEYRCYDPEFIDEEWNGENWFCAVYQGKPPYDGSSGRILFHSGEHGGSIGGGEMARAICEAIMMNFLGMRFPANTRPS